LKKGKTNNTTAHPPHPSFLLLSLLSSPYILLYIPKNMQEKTVMTKMEDEHHWKKKFN
jgi:hypothetical protein